MKELAKMFLVSFTPPLTICIFPHRLALVSNDVHFILGLLGSDCLSTRSLSSVIIIFPKRKLNDSSSVWMQLPLAVKMRKLELQK